MKLFRKLGSAGLAALLLAISPATASASDGPSLIGAGTFANGILCQDQLPLLHFTVAAHGDGDRTGNGQISFQLPDIGTCTAYTITADITCVIERGGEVLAWGPVRKIISPRSDPFTQFNFIAFRGINSSEGQVVSPVPSFLGDGIAPECTSSFFDELFQFETFPVVQGNVVIRPA